MKKILICLVLLFSFLQGNIAFAEWEKPQYETDCTYEDGGELSDFLTKCKPKQVAWYGDYKLDWGFKTQVNTWIKNISLTLWFLAVGVLVYAGMLFQFAAGEDEKINKAKNLIKYTLLGFLLLISAGSIIFVIINIVYFLAG